MSSGLAQFIYLQNVPGIYMLLSLMQVSFENSFIILTIQSPYLQNYWNIKKSNVGCLLQCSCKKLHEIS